MKYNNILPTHVWHAHLCVVQYIISGYICDQCHAHLQVVHMVLVAFNDTFSTLSHNCCSSHLMCLCLRICFLSLRCKFYITRGYKLSAMVPYFHHLPGSLFINSSFSIYVGLYLLYCLCLFTWCSAAGGCVAGVVHSHIQMCIYAEPIRIMHLDCVIMVCMHLFSIAIQSVTQ